jgi:hypothetical protein
VTRYRRSIRRMNPNEIRTNHVRSESAVRGYMENPNWSGPDFLGNGGLPLAHRNDDGQLVTDVGNHRIEAARRTGRRIRVEVAEPIDESKSKPKSGDTFFAWMWR